MAHSSKVESLAGTAALRAFGAAAARAPERRVKPLGRAVGRLVWRLSARHRRIALKNLRNVYGHEKSESELQDLARRVFEHFGQVAVEFFWLRHQSQETIRLLAPELDDSVLNQAYQEGRGAVVITGHFGNWEYLGMRLVANGHPLTVVARDSDSAAQATYINGIRKRGGFGAISKDEPASLMLKTLARNELLGILPDQNTIDKPIFVPFFGRLASTAPGVALLALRARCPVIPGFAVRTPEGFRIEIMPPLDIPQSGTLDERIWQVTAGYTSVIEKQIRRHPEQWLWFHDRWRRRPSNEDER